MSRPEPARLLVIDTAGARCLVAACAGPAVLAGREEAMARGHAERLFPLIVDTLAEAGWTARALTAVVVCTGPGGFTGARIGVAAARGLALALGRPAVGVDWFAALAGEARALVALPGPRGAVWAQRFEGGAPTGPALTLAAGDPALRPRPGEALLGAAEREAAGAAALAAAALRQPPGPGARPAPLYLRPPDAVPMAPLADAS